MIIMKHDQNGDVWKPNNLGKPKARNMAHLHQRQGGFPASDFGAALNLTRSCRKMWDFCGGNRYFRENQWGFYRANRQTHYKSINEDLNHVVGYSYVSSWENLHAIAEELSGDD